jgi:metalloendopeptidase OMA1, mitochondrial
MRYRSKTEPETDTRILRKPRYFRRRLSLGAASALASLVVAACSTVPETGRRQLLILPSSVEAQQGTLAFNQLKSRSRISSNPAANAKVRRVGRKVAAAVKRPDIRWEFAVFIDPTPNAFAIPGGKVIINSGLLALVDSDAELAAIVAHEIGHVIARHRSEQQSQSIVAALGGSVLDVALGSAGAPAVSRYLLTGAYRAGAQVGVLLPYARTRESEADRLGLIYMARAGYNPNAAVSIWRKLATYSRGRGGDMIPPILRTHPVDEQRIANIQKHLPEAQPN